MKESLNWVAGEVRILRRIVDELRLGHTAVGLVSLREASPIVLHDITISKSEARCPYKLELQSLVPDVHWSAHPVFAFDVDAPPFCSAGVGQELLYQVADDNVLNKPFQVADENVLNKPYQIADSGDMKLGAASDAAGVGPVESLSSVGTQRLPGLTAKVVMFSETACVTTDNMDLNFPGACAAAPPATVVGEVECSSSLANGDRSAKVTVKSDFGPHQSTSSCSSLIGKRVHHNHRKATTQASVKCNLEGSTLRDHGTHHNHRNATTQVPGRCNSEVSTLRDHGASRKDASHNHAAAVALWSAKLESLAKHPANVDSADLFGIRRKTTCSSMVSLFQVSSDEDVDDWMFEASSLKLTTRDYSVSLDSLPDISSNGVNALHADLFVKSVRHFVGTERANIFAETVADAACEAMLETWGRKVDVAALRSDYDHALVLLVELVASKVDAWRG
jgi:hypothetical protein